MASEIRYAVVRSRGCYGSGEMVYAARVSQTRTAAEKYAERRTRQYRTALAQYGGSSGGYRVVEVAADATVRTLKWCGWELDGTPDAGQS